MSWCAAALVLLLDASGSISPQDWQLQLEGHAVALEAPNLTRDPIAVMAVAFSDTPSTLVPWRLLRTPQDATRAAQEMRQAERPYAGGTNIGAALRGGLSALERAPCAAEQEVLDLVTDGEAAAEPTQAARDEAVQRGVRINSLGVGPPSAAEWLRENATTPGGFTFQVETWEQFSEVIRRKVTTEVAQQVLELSDDMDYGETSSHRGPNARRYAHN